jgi:hypothetical protein
MDDHVNQDALTRRRPHPAEAHLPALEHEWSTRRLGTRWTIAGSVILVAGTVGTLALAVINPDFLDAATGVLFAHLSGMLVVASGASLLTAGLIERVQQQQRTLVRQAMTRINTNAELLQTLNGITDGIVPRLEAIERAIRDLPDYGQGVIDGALLRTDAVGDREEDRQ